MRNKGLHVAIILDGNRRYAKKLGKEAWKGHEFGVKKVEKLLEWSKDLGVRELTLYSFSMDNFDRPEIEKKALFSLFKKNISRLEKDENLKKHQIRVKFIGKLEKFPEDIQKEMEKVMEMTKDNTPFKLNFAMAYSSKAEIVDSVKRIITKINNNEIKIGDVNESAVEENLYLSSSPDIFIRPGKEKRMSDFLLWQSAYSELFFIDKLWPEFEKEDLAAIIEEFKSRERRFGR
ncbi:di-trans,poly-cis-decaprenylcistransferase [Candidatus Woesearchaeota archaeon]|nr:di-trans,poly-cis-decaprenylcistransferase [Candidatus Woesearchaeota archaeon]